MPPKVNDLLANRYRIKKVLKGPRRTIFSAVYLACDTEMLDAEFVIKALASCPPKASPTNLQLYKQEEARFNRELEALQGIMSRNVVILHYTFREDDVRYMVLEYLRGGTLADHLRTKKKLDLYTVHRLGFELCCGLQEVHSKKNMIHLDIKPSNIFLYPEEGHVPDSTSPWVAVGDWGESRKLDKDKVVILENESIGTQGYRAPEISEKKRATPQSDIYSLGIVLFEALTGSFFYETPDPSEALGEVPKSLSDVILKATRNEPTARFDSVSQMLSQLKSISYPGGQLTVWKMLRTVLEAILIGAVATFFAEVVIKSDSFIPILFAILASVVTLGLGFLWHKEPDKEKYVVVVGALFAILSLVTAVVPPTALLPGTPTPTPTSSSSIEMATPTIAPTSTPKNSEATVIAGVFATQTASAATQTAAAPTPTNTPTATYTPTPTTTPLPDTPTPSPSPTNTPRPSPPPTSTPTPTPTPRPEGILSFSALVNGRYQTYVYNLANSASTPLYIHDGVVDADLQPGDHRLAYRWAESGRGGIWRMDLDGSYQQQLTGFVEDRSPHWSADGTGIFLGSTRGGDRVSRVFRINADGSGGELKMPIVGRDPVEPVGGQLLYAGWLTYDPGACGIIFYQWGRKAGAGEIEGTEGRVSDKCGDFRPDAMGGQVVFMRQENGQLSDVWRNQIGSGVERTAVNLTPDTPDSSEVLPIFSPDGQWIAFASNRGGAWGIYAIKADGSSKPALLLEIPPGTDFSDWNMSRLSWAK